MSNFKPTIWSVATLEHLNKALVYGDLVTRKYEGEITKYGDKVVINQVGKVTVKDYAGTVDAPEEVSVSDVTLDIDKQKYFNFKVEDVDAVQARIDLLDEFTMAAADEVAETIDLDIAKEVKNAGIKLGTAAAPLKVNAKNIYDTIVDISAELSKNNVSRRDRFIVLPSELIALLERDVRFVRSDEIRDNGFTSSGKVAGFEVRESNNTFETGGKFAVMAGSKEAIAYAGQISTIEKYRPQDGFSDAVKGLFVYGIKVIQPKALACAYLTVGTDEVDAVSV